MRNFLILVSSIVSIASYSQNLTQYVNPMIGTGGHGHTFPGPTLPFGMVQLSPDTRIDGSWDGCSGYHHSDTIIYGFSHTHLSGTGCSDYGDIAFMPYFSKKKLVAQSPLELYKQGVSYSHKNETAHAGFYSVVMNNHVTVDLATTSRAGIQRYTFNEDGYAKIVLNLKHRDELTQGSINELDIITYQGQRYSKAWAENQKLFYHFNLAGAVPINKVILKDSVRGNYLLALDFEVKKGTQIFIRTGISGVDIEGARKNVDQEIPDFDFDRVRYNGNAIWNYELSKIKVTGGSKKELINFYTALYHCMIHPSIMSDVDNRYRGRDDSIHSTKGQFDYYSVFSLWDTYRALHPLLTILDSKRTSDFVHTFIEHHNQGGRMPIWELWGNETKCMIGYHAVSVIWDAYNKGCRDFNAPNAFRAMKSMARENTDALNSYRKYGYVRADDDAESVSKTLEYAYNDWCIAQFAQDLGFDKDYVEFSQRSKNWLNVFDPSSGYMRPRKNSTLYEPFSPYMVDNNFTEANSFQYSFSVPHDITSLEKALGGKGSLDKKLDELFSAKSKTEGREQADITGLIGQYAHGNEPSHHIAWLYSDKKKRNRIVKKIRDEFYTNSPDGLIGNEDCGQMSAWYVWAALGMYPVCPGDNRLSTVEPIFDSMTFKTIRYVIKRSKTDTTNFYNLNIQHVPSIGAFDEYETQPYILPCQKIFKDKFWVKMAGGKKIFYSIDQSPFKLFQDSFQISQSCNIRFYNQIDTFKNKMQEANFYKLPDDRKVTLKHKYNPQYHAGGEMGLVDGVYGSENWRKGDWQGYQTNDFEAVIELDKEKTLKQIKTTFLQDQRSWIFFPKEYKIFISVDGINYTEIFKREINVPRDEDKNSIKTIKFAVSKNAKYIKVWARNYGKVPSWHPGAGGDAFIFIDEIEIK